MANQRRRFVVAFLVTALLSQLAQAQSQLVPCDQMDMGATASMQSTPGFPSDEPDAMIGTSTTREDAEHQMPVSSSCMVSAICVTGPAVPTISQPVADAVDVSRVIAFAMVAPPTRALRPDFPPPRV